MSSDDKHTDNVGSGDENPQNPKDSVKKDEKATGDDQQTSEAPSTDEKATGDDQQTSEAPSTDEKATGDDQQTSEAPSTDAAEGEKEQPGAIASLLDQFKKLMKPSETEEPKLESVLDEISFEGIARYINSDKCKKIVTMAGAGISTSAGIPDFRSPGTGLYDNLQKYNLPEPQAVFYIDYFKENPEPFFMLCKDLLPGNFKPTPCHYFIKLLDEKKKLLTHFTQNIDTLERMTGLGEDKIVEAHGSFATGHCQQCRQEYGQEWMKERILAGTDDKPGVPKCEKPDCEGVVKPDIVFFGESLPSKFITHVADLKDCDLLIIMGTSLVVQPFASLTNRVEDTTPRLYINLENTCSTGGDPFMAMLMGGQTFSFDSKDNIRDVFWQGTCDDGCYALADLLGWGDELRELVKTQHELLDQKQKKSEAAAKKPSAL